MVKHNKAAQLLLNLVFVLLVIFAVAPFLMLISSSFSSEKSLSMSGYSFFPREFSLDAYLYLLRSADRIFRAYGITILVTAVGTTLSVCVTILFAYTLSRSDYPLHNILAFFVFFTMLFNGGLVPTYIMYTQTFHIRNTLWAMIIPGHIMSAFYVIMMRSYFTANIPNELIEAARMDGAGEFRILTRIVVPLSKPMIATLSLMIGLSYWNDWQTCLYYINDESLFSIQAVLNTIISNIQYLMNNSNTIGDSTIGASMPSVSIRMAIAVVGVLPVLIIYPFVQKYFVKGIVVGGIKG